jgi:hypothetical protein
MTDAQRDLLLKARTSLDAARLLPGILTQEQFAHAIQRIMENPSASKQLARGRTAYWDDATSTVVIRDPSTGDGGTAFKPPTSRNYYENLK